MMDFEKLANENKFFRRLVLVAVLILIFVVVLWTWYRPPDIPAGTTAALGTVVGLLSGVIGFYQWSRNKDDEARERREKDDT